MKKLISLAITLTMLASVFAIGTSAALPTFRPGETEDVFTESFTDVAIGHDLSKNPLNTIVGAWATTSGSQRAVIASGDEAYGNALKISGFYKQNDDGSVISSTAASVGFGEVTGYAKYSVEFDINPQYASAAPNLVIPWGDDTKNPAVLMFSPDLFTDIDLQPHATVANAIALPEESLVTNKWYHVSIEVNNEAISAMTSFKADTIANNIKVTVKDLTTDAIVNATPVSTASAATDNVLVAQAYANVRTLTGNADMCLGLYSCNGNFYYVSGADGTKDEQSKAVYYFDNITFKRTPANILFETNGVLLEERTAVNQTANLGTMWKIPGGAIKAYDEENPDANIGDGFDAYNFVATFDATTDCDMFTFEMYGKNISNKGTYKAHINSVDDGGQSRMFRIPVEEAARNKKFSYKVINGKHVMYIYRAPFGSNDYTLLSDVQVKGGVSNVDSSGVRFMFHPNYGMTVGSYINYENLLVMNKGAVAITEKTDSTISVAYETGIEAKAFPALVFYDASGRMVDISTPGELEIVNGEGVANFDITDEDYKTAQILIWSSLTKPLPVGEAWIID